MQKRFIDPLFFAFLFAVDIVIWLIAAIFNSVPQPVMILAPALASITIIALGRTLMNMEPKRFWTGIAAVTFVFTVFLGLTGLITKDFNAGEGAGFANSVWFMGVALICSLMALFLAAVGAIPGPIQSDVEEIVADADKVSEESPAVDQVVEVETELENLSQD